MVYNQSAYKLFSVMNLGNTQHFLVTRNDLAQSVVHRPFVLPELLFCFSVLREDCIRAFCSKIMKRFAFYIFYIAVFFSALVFGTAITFIWNDQYWEFAVGSFGKCVNAGEGLSGGGGFSSYVFYDGMKLAFSRARFDSTKAAERCFQSQLRYASRVVEKEILFDEAREKIVGERVIVIFPPNEYTKTEWTSVISLDDDSIFEITSPSLRRTLNFEKKSRKY